MVLLALLATVVSGCIDLGDRVVGTGDVVTQTRQVASFDRILTKGASHLQIAVGIPVSVKVEAQPNIQEVIETTSSGGTLTVSEKKQYRTEKIARIIITAPSLSGLDIQGSSTATISGVHGPALDISISGAGDVSASGNIGRLSLDSSGVGNADLRRLQSRDAVVRLSGVGNARVGPASTLDVSVNGVGSVTYLGSPRIVHQEIGGIGHIAHD